MISRVRQMQGLKLSGSIGMLVVIQLACTLAVQIVVLRLVGAGPQTDAFIAAQTLPLVTTSIVGTALQGIWQPRLAIAADSDGHAELERALTMGCLLVVPLVLVLELLAPPLSRLLFVGFSSATIDLTIELTRISLVAMLFTVLSLILAAAGRAVGRFKIVEAIPAALGLVALVGVAVVVPTMGVEGAMWILAIRGFAICVILWMWLGCPGPRDPRNVQFAATSRGVFTLIGASSFYKLGPLVDRYWGSQALSGQLTLYNLAQSGMGAVAALLERAIALPIVPQISRALHASDYAQVKRIYRRALVKVWVIVFVCGIVGGLAAMASRPLVAELLQVTAAQELFLEMLGFALLGFLGVAAGGTVINSAFYSMGDVKTPVSVGTMGFFLGLVIKSVAFLTSGLVAMAIGTSLYYLVTMVLMIAILERRLDKSGSA